MMGMSIVVFTPTSQLAVTITLALLTIGLVLIVGIAYLAASGNEHLVSLLSRSAGS